MSYVKLRSWHRIWATRTRRTRCGLAFLDTAPLSAELPLDGKSCEGCLRLAAHDVTAVENDTVPA